MSWGGVDGEELRAKIKTELALTRVPLYRMSQAVSVLRHVEKGPELRALVQAAYDALDRIEFVLRR